MKCKDCIHNSVCKFKSSSSVCDKYHGHCKDCDEYRRSPLTEKYGCCVTSCVMDEDDFCGFWVMKNE